MSEPKWTKEYLYEQAQRLAEKSNQKLNIDHFWFIADRDLAGKAPTDLSDLLARAYNYVTFDEAMAKYGVAGDADIDASIRRLKIFNEAGTFKSSEDALRFFCKTNLLFLAREVFNKLMTFSTHARVCNFFVQKNPTIPYENIDKQDRTKERLLLYPRGSFKSTLDIVDCAQWIVIYPDIRILVLAAETGLATAFIGELKNYFTTNIGSDPTTFQRLFPQWTIPKKSDGAADKFICPCRRTGDDEKKEPTAWSASILSNLPGWHCDLMKGDDVVNDKNSETPMLLAKVIRKIDYAESLIDPGGFKDLLGTPYAPADLYAHTVESIEKPEDLRILAKPARWLKPESEYKEEKDAVDFDYVLLFEHDKMGRERLTNDFLNKKRRKNPSIYNSQYLLNPAGTKQIKFPLDLLIQRTISLEMVPTKLTYYILWDFAYAANSDNDYSVGAVIGLDEEHRVFVLEIFRDRYKDSDLAMEVARSYKQYQPRLVLIENSNGAQFLESSIRRYSEEMGVSYIPLDFFKCERTPNAKASRIGALQPLLIQGRLFFVNTIACLTGDQENKGLYDEFKDFGSTSHDDIPDAISHVHRVLPTASAEPRGPGGREEVQRMLKILAEREFDEMIHGYGAYAPIVPVQPIPVTPETPEDLYDPWGSPGFKQ